MSGRNWRALTTVALIVASNAVHSQTASLIDLGLNVLSRAANRARLAYRGAVVAMGGHLQVYNSTFTNSIDMGIMVRQGAALVCSGCRNGGEGIHLEENSVASLSSSA